MKKVLLGLALASLVVLVAAPVSAIYKVELRDPNSRTTLTPGEYTYEYYDFRNIGSDIATTSPQVLRLGTSEPRDRGSAFYVPSDDPTLSALPWASPNRATSYAAFGVPIPVYAGSFGTMGFYLRVPNPLPSNVQVGKTYREYFEWVVDDGGGWLGDDTKVYYDVTIDNKHAAYAGQSAYPTIPRGSSANVTIQFKNTGPTPWYKWGMRYSGMSAVRLGTSNPLDRGSGFYAAATTGWLGNSRIQLVEATVGAGDVGTFTFTLTAPAAMTPGVYYEYFRPICEYVGWMEDSGVNLVVTVT